MAANPNMVYNADPTIRIAGIKLSKHEKKLVPMTTLRNIDLAEEGALQPEYHTLERSTKREAFLLQVKGTQHNGNNKCSRCARGRGNFKNCTSVPGVCHSACGNCTFYSQYRDCSFHPEFKGMPQPALSQPSSSRTSSVASHKKVLPAKKKGQGKEKTIAVSSGEGDNNDGDDGDNAEVSAEITQLPGKYSLIPPY